MGRAPTTQERLNAAAQRRVNAQHVLTCCLRDLNTAAGQRHDEAVTLCCRPIWDIDGISTDIDRLLELRAIEQLDLGNHQ